jgi:hypothetical protein
MDICLKSGGRLPKNLSRAIRDAGSGEPAAAGKQDWFKRIAIVAAGGVAIWLVLRVRQGHRLESSDEEIFKRRPHRWDPWLKRIGYFGRDRKKKN